MNKKYWFILGLIAFVFAGVIYLLKPQEQSSVSVEQSAPEPQVRQPTPLLTAGQPVKDVVPTLEGTNTPIDISALKNRQYIVSIYDKSRPPEMLEGILKKYHYFKQHGVMQAGNARENYFSEAMMEILKHEEVSKEEVIDALGYPPRSYISEYINENYDLKINTLMGIDNTANYAVYQGKSGEYVGINQQNINDPNSTTYVGQSLMAEFVNIVLGEQNDIGGVYQNYSKHGTQVLSFIYNDEAYSIHATDISKQELMNIANDLIRLSALPKR